MTLTQSISLPALGRLHRQTNLCQKDVHGIIPFLVILRSISHQQGIVATTEQCSTTSLRRWTEGACCHTSLFVLSRVGYESKQKRRPTGAVAIGRDTPLAPKFYLYIRAEDLRTMCPTLPGAEYRSPAIIDAFRARCPAHPHCLL